MRTDVRRLRIDLVLARIVARAQLRDPVVATGALADALRQSLERQAGVTDQRKIRTTVQARILRAAVGGNQRGRAPHVAAVIETEVARHAGKQDAVGFAQRVAARMAHLQRVLRPEQAARHP